MFNAWRRPPEEDGACALERGEREKDAGRYGNGDAAGMSRRGGEGREGKKKKEREREKKKTPAGFREEAH